MLAETLRRLTDTGVRVLCAEAIAVGAGRDIATAEPVIEAAAALGARYINVTCDDPDTARFAAMFAALADLARPYGVRPVVEFMAFRPVRSLATAGLDRARQRGRRRTAGHAAHPPLRGDRGRTGRP